MTARDDSISVATICKISAAPLILSMLTTAACYAVAGFSLGFYIGPFAMTALILPPLVAFQKRITGALLAAAAVIDGVGIVWLIPALTRYSTIGQWLASYVTLAAFAFALCGVVILVRRAIGSQAASALVTAAALAWLTWPVWMSPWLSASIVAWLTPAHPLMAINHVWLDLGVWMQQRLMYQFTALGQDVPYALPRSVWPCVVWHGAIGVILLLPAMWKAGAPPRARWSATTSPPARSDSPA